MTKNLAVEEKRKISSYRPERRRSPSPPRREEPVKKRKPDYNAKFEYSYTFSDSVEGSDTDDLLRKRLPSDDHNDLESTNKKVI